MNPRHPIFIISKGRSESRLTVKAFEEMSVPYRVVVEPQEYDLYAQHIDSKNILKLPFSNLGQGSIPARNWAWEHSVAEGHRRHWIIDDNIQHFYRLNNNSKVPVGDGTIFRCMEDFAERYENVALAGPHYYMFAPRKYKLPPLVVNTRVYSCILIKNDIPHRWRGKYNEDTDLSLRVLKDGYCTVLFMAFLAKKIRTMKMRGGNTDELYKDDGRLRMAESLREQHPDVVQIKRRWGRWQHVVDYRPFASNEFIPRDGLVIPHSVNNYGMEIRERARISA
jgi:hypothetical protein